MHVYYILCTSLFVLDNLPDVSITGTTSTDTGITVNMGNIRSGIERVIIGYHRLDLGVSVVGEYGNNPRLRTSRTFSSLVTGAEYRITAWGLGGGGDKRRSQSPAVREVTTKERSEHSDVTISLYVHNIMCSVFFILYSPISSKAPHYN